MEKIVYAVMNTRGNQTNYGKSDELPKFLGDIQSLELVCQNSNHLLQRPSDANRAIYNKEVWHQYSTFKLIHPNHSKRSIALRVPTMFAE